MEGNLHINDSPETTVRRTRLFKKEQPMAAYDAEKGAFIEDEEQPLLVADEKPVFFCFCFLFLSLMMILESFVG